MTNELPGGATGEFIGLEDIEIPPIETQFAGGFGRGDFVYGDTSLQAPIPVILAEQSLAARGLMLGDTAYLGYFGYVPEVPIVVIGSHNGGIDRYFAQHAALVPFEAMELIRDNLLRSHYLASYITFRFETDTAYNRDIASIRYEIEQALDNKEQNDFMKLELFLWDDELRLVVGQMEQSLSLLQLLYPIVIALSVIVGAGFAVLLLLQNAKNAAILRVLGFTKIRSRAMLSIEHILSTLLGAALGLTALYIFGVNFGSELPLLAGLYIVGAIIGAITGAALITNRAPLDLLQTKE
jgi:hypothetical protein